jgi:outer membrane protein assembly factor BamD (BamD/ComL family)
MIISKKDYVSIKKYTLLIISYLFIAGILSACAPNIIGLQEKGRESFSNKEYEKAIKYYEEALALNPKNSSVHFNLGLCYKKLKLYRKSAHHFTKAVEYEIKDEKKIKYERFLEAVYKIIYTSEVEVIDTISVYEELLDQFPNMIVDYALPGRLDEMKYFKKIATERLQELIFNEVKLTNVPRAFELYIEYYPDSKYVEEAKILLDTLRYEITVDKNDIEAFKEFKEKFHDSAFVSRINEKLDDLIYEQYKFKETLEGYEEFAIKYPRNKNREKAIDKIYTIIKYKNEVELYERFVSNFPDAEMRDDIMEKVEELRFEGAKERNTVEAYEDFIDRFPRSVYTKTAELKLIQLHYENAKEINTIEAYDEFINKFKRSKYAVVAEDKKMALIYEDVKKRNKKEDYEEFIKNYPKSKHKKAAENKIIELEYNKALEKDEMKLYGEFLEKYEGSIYADEIKSKLEKTKYAAIDELGTIRQIEKFIANNPDSDLIGVAKKKLERVRFVKAKKSANAVEVLKFIKMYPRSNYLGRAYTLLDEVRYKAAIKYNQAPDLISFLDKYPDSIYVQDVKARIRKLKIEEIRSFKTIQELEKYIEKNEGSEYLIYAYELIDKYRYEKVKKIDSLKDYELFINEYPNNRYVPDVKQRIRELQEGIKEKKMLADVKKKKSVKAMLKYSNNTELVVYDISFFYEYYSQPSYLLLPSIEKSSIGFEIEKNKVKTAYANQIYDINSIKFNYKDKGRILGLFGGKEYALSKIDISYASDDARNLNKEWNNIYLSLLKGDRPDTFYTEVYMRAKSTNTDEDISAQLFEYNPLEPYLVKVIFKR